MKNRRLFFFGVLLLICTVGFSQTDSTDVRCFPQRYKLYKTRNNFTFLKLDTRTGRIWHVQWGTGTYDSMEYVLSERNWADLIGREERDGRYELYPTTNIYNFIMLDTIDGDTFQVQWSMEEEYRLVNIIKVNWPNDDEE